LFSKEEVSVDTYPVCEIKWYKGTPQLIKKGNLVELYLLHDEVEFEFASGNEARKFVNVSLTLLTNKTSFERNAEKLKNTISMVDNSLGIDSVKLTGNIIKSGTIGKTTNVIGKGFKTIGKLIKK